ncbi:hypothetical protein QTN47_20040 [Danxiaibacter flavus]|uniref:Uncharacterized protein n=1 Tax=Danxiaibacter flavus TaxID=3049108 RepID=A0ABV3ZMK3_9BACT|nr:hypothetical protein QNM32_20050 [Chitinophagaceae bacterium DXS]
MNQNTLGFKKEDLSEADYSWDENLAERSEFEVQEPTRRSFDRYNGNHILYMINYFAQAVQQVSLKEVKLLEKILREKLPIDIKSEVSVFRWLVNTQTGIVSA